MGLRRVVWSSEVFLSDWEQTYADLYPNVKTDIQKYDIMNTVNSDYLLVVRNDLNKIIEGTIVAFVFVKTDKEHILIRPLNNNLVSVLDKTITGIADGKYTWFVNNRQNLWCEAKRSNITTKVLYRYIPNNGNFNYRMENLEVLNKQDNLTCERILKSTKSVGPFIKEIYKW